MCKRKLSYSLSTREMFFLRLSALFTNEKSENRENQSEKEKKRCTINHEKYEKYENTPAEKTWEDTTRRSVRRWWLSPRVRPNASVPHLAQEVVSISEESLNVLPPVLLHNAVDVMLDEELVDAGGDKLALQYLLDPASLDQRIMDADLQNAEILDATFSRKHRHGIVL